MSIEERSSVEHLNAFFCNLHTLVHVAEATSKSLSEVENGHFQTPAGAAKAGLALSGEPGTIRLTRTAAKAFAMGADEKSGCFGEFKVYVREFLKENKMLSVPLVPHRGSRFNILFFNAANIYFFHEKMLAYLNERRGLNRLLQSVLADLNEPFFVGGLKALGLISKLITTPFWNLVESKELLMMDMNVHFLALVKYIEDAILNLQDFMSWKLLYRDTVVDDRIFEKLISPSEFDGDTEIILSVVLPTILKKFESELKDFLPEGVYSNPTESMREETKSACKTNKWAEMVFGYADRLLRVMPNSGHLAKEAYTMFCLNKTLDWVLNKSVEEQKVILSNARKEARSLKAVYRERREVILQRRRQKQKDEAERLKELARKKSAEKEKMINDILFYTLWQSEDDIKEELKCCKTNKAKEEALKAQIRFREKVLDQSSFCDKKLFVFSMKKENGNGRKNLTWEQLAENLSQLLSKAGSKKPNNDLLEKAQIFHVRRIKMKFAENEYIGKVTGTVPGYPNWINVKFEGDGATYTLHEDLENGDVEILTD